MEERKEDKNKILLRMISKFNSELRSNFVDTKVISIEEWNKIVAPNLMDITMMIEDVDVSAKTYKLPENYF